jgi:hypothetical protein
VEAQPGIRNILFAIVPGRIDDGCPCKHGTSDRRKYGQRDSSPGY